MGKRLTGWSKGLHQTTARRYKLVPALPVPALPARLAVSNIPAEANPVDTLQGQFSGYGSTSSTVARCLDKIGLKEPLEEWSDETIENVVKTFIEEKFPTVFALNKIDHPDADKVCWTSDSSHVSH